MVFSAIPNNREARWLDQVTGLWGERRAQKTVAYCHVSPRVISPQNRMRLTQSPRRALTRLQVVPDLPPQGINLWLVHYRL
jgi:hypothetical protein